MSQKLILPIDDCAFSAAYKNAAYKKQQGYEHYGVDLYNQAGNQTVKAIGTGVVVAAGLDGSDESKKLGRCCVIVYKDCELPDGSVKSLACRMFHFDSIAVKAGETVDQGDVIGLYGNTGSTLVNGNKMGKHLHIEFDTDVEYPQYAVGISSSGYIIRKGTVDSTVNPSSVWFLGDGQKIKGIYNGWYSDADVNLPLLNPVAEEVEEVDTEDDFIPIAYDEETETDYYGDPAWYIYDKEIGGYRFFDKWWRKVPTETFPGAGEYATDAQKKKAKAWTSSIKEIYTEANDPDGTAGKDKEPEDLPDADFIPLAYDEETEENCYGNPAWYVYDKEIGGYRLFDKWWRKISSDTFPSAGVYATDAEKKKAKAWTSDIKEYYSEATDPKGIAGWDGTHSDTGDTSDTEPTTPDTSTGDIGEESPEEEIARLRAAVTAYEVEKATVINTLRSLIETLEASN